MEEKGVLLLVPPHRSVWLEVTGASAVPALSELIWLKCCLCSSEEAVGLCVCVCECACVHVAGMECVRLSVKSSVVVKASPACPAGG